MSKVQDKKTSAAYYTKVSYLLSNLEQNIKIKRLSDLKYIQPMDCKVYYWLRDNGFISYTKGMAIKLKGSKPSTTDIDNLVKFIRTKKKVTKVSKPSSVVKRTYTPRKKVIDAGEFANLIVDKAKAKGYDLVLNVKLVVTSIEYKL